MTNEVVSNAGATDAYSTADAIATFLREGNATFDFKRNYNGSGLAPGAEITYDILNRAREGTCSEFTTVFVTMKLDLLDFQQDLSQDMQAVLGQVMDTKSMGQIWLNGVKSD